MYVAGRSEWGGRGPDGKGGEDIRADGHGQGQQADHGRVHGGQQERPEDRAGALPPARHLAHLSPGS